MTDTALRAGTAELPRLPGLPEVRRRWFTSMPAWGVVLLLLAGSVAARLPFVATPLSPDEGGFLMVAGQWSPGTSLYGNYWVDRPPLLIGLFQLADLGGGGAVALRLTGIAAVMVSVLLAAVVGRVVAPSRPYAAVVTAATAAVFLSSPLFGASEVDGELLAVPFVLVGIIAVLRSTRSRGRSSRLAWWATAGVAATAAAAIKQDMLEVFVAGAASIAMLVFARRRWTAAEAALAFSAGASAALALLLWWASVHGTSPGGLWDAVVSFRADASAVISRSAPDTAAQRAAGVAVAFVSSGALAVLLAAVVPTRWSRRSRDAGAARRGSAGSEVRDLRLLALAVVAWEVFAVAVGGSYWLHYLVGTVPGLVLTVAAVARQWSAPRLRWTAAALGYAAIIALASAVVLAVRVGGPSTDVQVENYLAAHARPGDTGVVAFGNPALLQGAGLSSPYPELWSLPVRVRDPDLTQFDTVLEGTDRPSWVVVSGSSLGTWGVDAGTAQSLLDREYHPVQVVGDWHVYHLRTARR